MNDTNNDTNNDTKRRKHENWTDTSKRKITPKRETKKNKNMNYEQKPGSGTLFKNENCLILLNLSILVDERTFDHFPLKKC